jgi:ABC-2 type transport system permease protein
MNSVVTQSGVKSWAANYLWLIKREFWEHRALYIAPMVYAGLVLIMALISAFGWGDVNIEGISWREGMSPDNPPPEVRGGARLMVYAAFAVPFMFIAAIVTLYYSLDALYADRRDRSVLFWKSLPVSDTETVFAKLGVAAFFGSAAALVLSIVTLVLVLCIATIALALRGMPTLIMWTHIPLLPNIAFILYMWIAMALWYLPIWTWCLLASSWARRAPFLWAVVPAIVVGILEYQVFGTKEFAQLLLTRLTGVFSEAIDLSGSFMSGANDYEGLAKVGLADVLTPATFFSSAQLWGGLAASAVMIAATVWMRRFRESS